MFVDGGELLDDRADGCGGFGAGIAAANTDLGEQGVDGQQLLRRVGPQAAQDFVQFADLPPEVGDARRQRRRGAVSFLAGLDELGGGKAERGGAGTKPAAVARRRLGHAPRQGEGAAEGLV